MVNKVTLVGRLGRDPEVRYTASQVPVCTFSLATDWQNRNGEKQTEWHNIVAWRKLAEICGQYLNKGKLIYIEGRLQTRDWDDRDGNKRRTTEIVATEMKMLSGPGEGGGRPAAAAAGETSDTMEVGITDDDIPF